MSHQSAARRVTSDLHAVDDQGCTILHVDMDAFFAAVELRRRPELRGRPMMVAGSSGRSVVLSATYEARAYGVRSAMPAAQARARCPGLVVVEPDMSAYREASRHLMELLADITPVVEPVSVDEAFLDVSGSLRRLGRPARIAQQIRESVREHLALSATVGLSGTKFVAKLASSLAKPDGLLVVPRDDVAAFLSPLPLSALWGAGPRTVAKLESAGLTRVGDVAATPVARLARIVGVAAAESLHALARGHDPRRVTPQTAEVSIGAEQTFEIDTADPDQIQRVLLRVAHTAGARMRTAGYIATTAVLKVRFADFSTVTRSHTVTGHIESDREVYRAAMRSWQRLGTSRQVRLLGIRLENLRPRDGAETQLELVAESTDENWRRAQETLDEMRARYGAAAPRPASLVRRP